MANGKAGAPMGNTNARNGKLWRQALDRALAKRGRGDRNAALDELAEKFLDTVVDITEATEKRNGSIAGFVELGDRLDGRSQQGVTVGGDPDQPLRITHRLG